MNIHVPSNISLLLIGDGEDEMHAIQGRIERSEAGHNFVCADSICIPLDPEWLGRAKLVTEDLQSIFGEASQYFIPLAVGPMPDGIDPLTYLKTGLNLGVAP
jgi:hypothetical protein